MKNLILNIMVLGLLMTPPSFAGGRGGNGGGAHYCPNPTDTQKKWESYDIWEAKNPLPGSRRKALNIPDWDGTKDREYYRNRSVARLAEQSVFMANSVSRLFAFIDGDHL